MPVEIWNNKYRLKPVSYVKSEKTREIFDSNSVLPMSGHGGDRKQAMGHNDVLVKFILKPGSENFLFFSSVLVIQNPVNKLIYNPNDFMQNIAITK